MMRALTLTLTAAAAIAVVTLFASDMETEDDPCEWAENTQAEGENKLSEDILDQCPHLMMGQRWPHGVDFYDVPPHVQDRRIQQYHELYWERELNLYRRQQEHTHATR